MTLSLEQHSYSSLLTLKKNFPVGWVFKDSCLEAVDASRFDSGCVKLTIIGQALNLNMLFGVQTKLSDFLYFKSFQFHSLSEKYGECVIVANVNVVNSQNLAEAIADTAINYHLEIALQSHLPNINEPGLLVMDMDSTVIQIECIDEIAKLAGVGEKVSAVTEQAMQGELDFKASLVARVACLDGVEIDKLEMIRDSIPLMPGLIQLIQRLKENKWKIVIASGGFTYFADYLQQRLELDAVRANVLGSENGKLLGKVDGDIVDAKAKADAVEDFAQHWQITPSQTIAMGDGANDLLMMQAASLGVAFHAKPIVERQADVAIRFGGLHTLLYYLGE